MANEKPDPIFPDARNASTPSAWASHYSLRANNSFSPSPLISSFSYPNTSTTSSRVRELSRESLDALSNDPVALIEVIEILRMCILLDEIPSALLDARYNLLQRPHDLKEIHICI
jgi:hypothetical protein